jgi:hypothetical protein
MESLNINQIQILRGKLTIHQMKTKKWFGFRLISLSLNILQPFHVAFIVLCCNFMSAHATEADRVIQAHKWSAKNCSVSIQTVTAPDNMSIGNSTAGDWVY